MAVRLYRSMKQDRDQQPLCEPSARGLGARVPVDIETDKNDEVHPFTGGMSVAPNTPKNLRPWRRPPKFGGYGRDPVFYMDDEAVREPLQYMPDGPAHGMIEPGVVMALETYQTTLCETREQWRLA